MIDRLSTLVVNAYENQIISRYINKFFDHNRATSSDLKGMQVSSYVKKVN